MAITGTLVDIRGAAVEPILEEVLFANKTIAENYVTFNTDIKAGELIAPVKVIINLSGVDVKEHYTVYKHASFLLDRELKLSSPKPKVTKPWYKFW